MDELTAEKVFEMVGDRLIPPLVEYVWPGQASRMVRPHGWYLGGRQPLPPAYALALIVDAAKREMGEDWHGCTPYMPNEWVAYYKRGDDGVCSAEGHTEAQAVLAAWRAWKEGR